MKHIDKLFKEKLYNHEAVVPEGMWEKIVPIAEEESGRALLWFWLAGLLSLLLGGYGIYKMANTPNPTDPGTLVYQQEMQELSNDLEIKDNPSIVSNTLEEKHISEAVAEEPAKSLELEDTEKISPIKKEINIGKEKITVSQTPHNTQNIAVNTENHTSPKISNTVENITNVIGIPANLVITRSYINKEGSVIKQSNLTDDSGIESPVYDVIINSEAKELNAGALLRIIEPLENIPLPAFQKKLKKKTLNEIL